MSDVNLFQTPDDGDIEALNGVITLTDTPAPAAFISLFGGHQDGAVWWGDAAIISRTQTLLDTLPPTSGNLLRLQDAAAQDLAWMTRDPYNWTVSVVATIPQVNHIQLSVTINGVTTEFVQEWTA